jgi:hypothetical protein
MMRVYAEIKQSACKGGRKPCMNIYKHACIKSMMKNVCEKKYYCNTYSTYLLI